MIAGSQISFVLEATRPEEFERKLCTRMQTRCPNCSTIVRSTDGVTWTLVNAGCRELADTAWRDRAELCPVLSYVVQPDVALPGISRRPDSGAAPAMQAEHREPEKLADSTRP
jgi:hypothetical protein